MKTSQIKHYFWQNDGILLILNNGEEIFELTPDHQTGFEHLQSLKKRF